MFRVDPAFRRHPDDPDRQRSIVAPASGRWLRRAMSLLAEWLIRSRSRQELSQLDERQLADIGLARSQATFESDKYFFRR